MENQEITPQEVKRPVFLTVLSIFSFIFIGFSLIGILLAMLSGKLSPDQMEQMKVDTYKLVEQFQGSGMEDFSALFEQSFRMVEYQNNNFWIHNLVSLLCFVTGFLGVIYMVKAFKKGFHMYIIYNIIYVLLIYVSVPANEVPSYSIIINVIFSGLFIFLYSRNLKWFTK